MITAFNQISLDNSAFEDFRFKRTVETLLGWMYHGSTKNIIDFEVSYEKL